MTGGRENIEPRCPFCGTGLERPVERALNSYETVLAGTCRKCGALYIADPTNRGVGELMAQALALAAEQVSREASDLAADEDYEDVVLNYDIRRHRSSGVNRGFADGRGRMYVLKLKTKTS
jgi:hypothetical protein